MQVVNWGVRFKDIKVNTNKQKVLPGTVIQVRSDLKIVNNSRFEWVIDHLPFFPPIISLGLAIILSLVWVLTGFAQSRAPVIMQLRVMESDKTGFQSPTGLAFSAKNNAFYVIDGPGPGESPSATTEVINISTFARREGSVSIAALMTDPINIAYDNKSQRLFILQHPENQLLELRDGADGNPDSQTLIPHDASFYGLQDPQGMTVDPASGDLFVLDAIGPRIIRIGSVSDGNIGKTVISSVNLQSKGLSASRGLAFDSTTRHLFLLNPAENRLYELSLAGTLVASLDLSQFQLGNPQGMVFAPSGDQTDDPQLNSLYLADSSTGQIIEFSLSASASANLAIAASPFQSALIRVTNLGAISPPSRPRWPDLSAFEQHPVNF